MHRLRLVAAALCFIAVGQSCITEEKRGGEGTPRNGREAVGGVLFWHHVAVAHSFAQSGIAGPRLMLQLRHVGSTSNGLL